MNLQTIAKPLLPNRISEMEMSPDNQLSLVLSRVFHNEPHLAYLMPEEETRRIVSPWLFQAAIDASRLCGEVRVTDAGDGGALWMSPEYRWTVDRIVRSGTLEMPFQLDSRISRRFLKLTSSLATARKQLAPASHWYLMVLGVEKSEQEEAIGGALIEPVLSRADSTGTPCYVETFNEKRLRFYKNHGFRIAGAGKVPGGGPSFWAMTRTAKISAE